MGLHNLNESLILLTYCSDAADSVSILKCKDESSDHRCPSRVHFAIPEVVEQIEENEIKGGDSDKEIARDIDELHEAKVNIFTLMHMCTFAIQYS